MALGQIMATTDSSDSWQPYSPSVLRRIGWLLFIVFTTQLLVLGTTRLFWPDVRGLAEMCIDVVLSVIVITPITWTVARGDHIAHARSDRNVTVAGAWISGLGQLRPQSRVESLRFVWLGMVVALVQIAALGLTFVLTPHFGGFWEALSHAVITSLLTAPLAWLVVQGDYAMSRSSTNALRPAHIPASPHVHSRVVMYGVLSFLVLLTLVEAVLALNDEDHRQNEIRMSGLATKQTLMMRSALLAFDGGDPIAAVTAASEARRFTQDIERMASLSPQNHSHDAESQANYERVNELIAAWRATDDELWKALPDNSTEGQARTRELMQRSGNILAQLSNAFILASQSHSDDTRQRIIATAALTVLLVVALAIGAVEPLARYLKLQHRSLIYQSVRLEQLALVAEHTRNPVVIMRLSN
jgi:hypothetical protein